MHDTGLQLALMKCAVMVEYVWLFGPGQWSVVHTTSCPSISICIAYLACLPWRTTTLWIDLQSTLTISCAFLFRGSNILQNVFSSTMENGIPVSIIHDAAAVLKSSFASPIPSYLDFSCGWKIEVMSWHLFDSLRPRPRLLNRHGFIHTKDVTLDS